MYTNTREMPGRYLPVRAVETGGIDAAFRTRTRGVRHQRLPVNHTITNPQRPPISPYQRLGEILEGQCPSNLTMYKIATWRTFENLRRYNHLGDVSAGSLTKILESQWPGTVITSKSLYRALLRIFAMSRDSIYESWKAIICTTNSQKLAPPILKS